MKRNSLKTLITLPVSDQVGGLFSTGFVFGVFYTMDTWEEDFDLVNQLTSELITDKNNNHCDGSDLRQLADIREMWWIKYERYISSPEWKLKRETIIKRDNHKCTKCNSRKSLRVHHLTYVNVGDEKPDDLITVCNECHLKIHNIL